MEPTTAAAAAAPAAGLGGMNGIIFAMIAFMLIMFFLNSRTQKKRDAEQKKLIGSLQKGDRVILIGGIVGTVAGFNGDLIEVKISETSKLSVLPSGIVAPYKTIPTEDKANGVK